MTSAELARQLADRVAEKITFRTSDPDVADAVLLLPLEEMIDGIEDGVCDATCLNRREDENDYPYFDSCRKCELLTKLRKIAEGGV